MTIICYRDGVLAADGLGVTGGVVEETEAVKIVRTESGMLLGAAGRSTVVLQFLRDFAVFDGFALEDSLRHLRVLSNTEHEDFQGLAVLPDGNVFLLSHDRRARKVNAPFVSLGGAWELAHGAMLMGATAQEAVLLCCDNHVMCGGRIRVERLPPPLSDPEEPEKMDDPVPPSVDRDAGRLEAFMESTGDLADRLRAESTTGGPRSHEYLTRMGLR